MYRYRRDGHATATVTTDTDLYDKPNDNGDAQIIGKLTTDQVVTLDTTKNSACSTDAWCTLTNPAGAVWGDVRGITDRRGLAAERPSGPVPADYSVNVIRLDEVSRTANMVF
jgi:hypothetical protein